jgi:hypothetical protein
LALTVFAGEVGGVTGMCKSDSTGRRKNKGGVFLTLLHLRGSFRLHPSGLAGLDVLIVRSQSFPQHRFRLSVMWVEVMPKSPLTDHTLEKERVSRILTKRKKEECWRIAHIVVSHAYLVRIFLPYVHAGGTSVGATAQN